MVILVKCAECKDELDADVHRDEILVAPCKACMELSREAGYDAGHDDGYGEGHEEGLGESKAEEEDEEGEEK